MIDEAESLARFIQNVAVAHSNAGFRGARLDMRNVEHARYLAREVVRMRAEYGHPPMKSPPTPIEIKHG